MNFCGKRKVIGNDKHTKALRDSFYFLKESNLLNILIFVKIFFISLKFSEIEKY